jgi:hypothetical protein
MDHMKNLLELDDYTEFLPENEMDQDLKKVLKEMAEAITVVSYRQAHSTDLSHGLPSSGSSIENRLTMIESKLGILEERSIWHRNIGWGIAGLYGLAFMGIITFWVPREIADSRRDIESTVEINTAKQLLPIQTQLARITALMELKQTKDVAEAIHQSANFTTPGPAIEAIKTIAQQAKADQLAVAPEVLQTANSNIQSAAASDLQLKEAAWSARLALVDYRSSLQKPFQGKTVTVTNQEPPFKIPRLPTVEGLVYSDVTQRLDGAFWKDTVFENAHIVYDGGPMALQNVRFINCRFTMNYSRRTDRLANLILDQNIVSGSLS